MYKRKQNFTSWKWQWYKYITPRARIIVLTALNENPGVDAYKVAEEALRDEFYIEEDINTALPWFVEFIKAILPFVWKGVRY